MARRTRRGSRAGAKHSSARKRATRAMTIDAAAARVGARWMPHPSSSAAEARGAGDVAPLARLRVLELRATGPEVALRVGLVVPPAAAAAAASHAHAPLRLRPLAAAAAGALTLRACAGSLGAWGLATKAAPALGDVNIDADALVEFCLLASESALPPPQPQPPQPPQPPPQLQPLPQPLPQPQPPPQPPPPVPLPVPAKAGPPAAAAAAPPLPAAPLRAESSGPRTRSRTRFSLSDVVGSFGGAR